MDQRIEKNVPTFPSGFERFRRAVGSIAYNVGGENYGAVTDEEIEALEATGCDIEAVQAVIDRLAHSRIVEDQRDAALLRGAFNELLARVPDEPQPESPAETETA